jgi:hypothetical protein
MRASRIGLLCGAWLCVASGCESAQQKCDKARNAAEAAWSGYVEALERVHKNALATQREAHGKLSGDIEHRLAPAAQKLADARYDRNNSAWLRAYQSSYHDACARDPECSSLTQRKIEAKATIDDLVDRLSLARAAHEAALGEAEKAKAAAAATIVDPKFPQLKQAQQLSAVAYEKCKAVAR